MKKETLAQVFSCEFHKICKNTFSYKATPVVASGTFYTSDQNWKSDNVFADYVKFMCKMLVFLKNSRFDDKSQCILNNGNLETSRDCTVCYTIVSTEAATRGVL